MNDTLATSPIGNAQFYPGRLSDTVSIIQDMRGLFDEQAATIIAPAVKLNGFYNAKSNPLIGQVITSKPFGVLAKTTAPFDTLENLAVFETEPEVSRLDIFWETSTSGLVSELNTAVATQTGGVQTTAVFNLNLNEGMAIGTSVAGIFYGENIIGERIINARIKGEIAATGIVDPSQGFWIVRDANGKDVTDDFILKETGDGTSLATAFNYTLETKIAFYYGPEAATLGNFTFSFTYQLFTAGTPDVYTVPTTPPVKSGQLQNVAPTIDGACPRALAVTTSGLPAVVTLTGKNGSANAGKNTNDLTWTITSQSQNGSAVSIFTMTTTNNQGIITASTGAAAYVVVARVTDAGGLTADCTFCLLYTSPSPRDS